LLYKIHEKLKKYAVEEKELINAVGNDIIGRVKSLMTVLLPEKENLNSLKGEEYGLLDIKIYLNESTNPTINKYKSVVKEYHKKYCA